MIIKNLKFTIPLDEVLLRLKYNVRKSEISPSVQALIDEMMDEGVILSEPQAIVDDYQIDSFTEDEVLLVDTDFTLRSRSLVDHLKDCYKVSVIICTIGPGCQEKIAEFLAAKEISNAATLDAVSSESVEAFTESVNVLVNKNAEAEGATTVMRFSTGYGDWSVAEQRRIIDALQGGQIGVSVTDSALMLPEKTVSACIGWKKDENLRARKALNTKG